MTAEQILQILRTGSADQLQAFVEGLPDSTFKGTVLPMIGSAPASMKVVLLAPLSTQLCAGRDAEIGAALAYAAHERAVELYEAGGEHGLLPTTLSGFASNYASASNELGNYDDVLAFTGKWIPYYQRLPEPDNLRSLKAARIEALIQENRIDEAAVALEDDTLFGHWSTDMQIQRLVDEVASRQGGATETEGGAVEPDFAGAVGGRMIVDAIKGMISDGIDDPAARDDLLEAAEGLDPSNRLDPNTPEGADGLKALADLMTGFVEGESSPLDAVRKIREQFGEPDDDDRAD